MRKKWLNRHRNLRCRRQIPKKKPTPSQPNDTIRQESLLNTRTASLIATPLQLNIELRHLRRAAHAQEAKIMKLNRSIQLIMDLVLFTDSSWQDCPDTGRSTTGYLIFYRGGVIDANSMLQIPVAMSSCEAEVMACCSGSMAAAHVHMLLYDMKYLGTKRYNEKQIALPNPPTIIMVNNESVRAIRCDATCPPSPPMQRHWRRPNRGCPTRLGVGGVPLGL